MLALVRKPSEIKNPKLKSVVINFDDIEAHAKELSVQDVFCCLGTTIKAAGSRAAFYKVDYSYVLDVARLLKAQGAERFFVVSAMGSDKHSRIFYNQVKGEMEEALRALEFKSLHVFRPSLLLGQRKEFRMGEKIATQATKILKPVFLLGLKKFEPIEAAKVAKFMVEASHSNVTGFHIYESDKMQ